MGGASQSGREARMIARVTGAAYLAIAALGLFAYFAVTERFFASNDPAATYDNVSSALGLFNAGVAAYAISFVLDAGVSFGLWRLLRRAGRTISDVSGLLRLLYVAMHFAAFLGLLGVTSLIGDVGAATEVYERLEGHRDGFTVSLIAFGAHLVLAGLLIVRSSYLPTFIGVFVALAGVGYVVDGAAFLYAPDYAAASALIAPLVAISAIFGEFALIFWLLIKSVDQDRWSADA